MKSTTQTQGHILNFEGVSTVSSNWDEVYAEYLDRIYHDGDVFEGRNGETRSVFGASIRVDLRVGFPLTRLRKMPWKNLCREMLFDIGFSTNVSALGPAKHFWDFLADADGELGASAYCRQWRQWPASAPGTQMPNEQLETAASVDQLMKVINTLTVSPNSRQATVITHNPTAIDPACPPCHLAMQFSPTADGWLDIMVPARSNDMVVGFPLDIARYALILMAISTIVGMKPRFVYMPSSNSHIYKNCYDLVDEMLQREFRPECHASFDPSWKKVLRGLEVEHFILEGYDPHPAIKVAVN